MESWKTETESSSLSAFLYKEKYRTVKYITFRYNVVTCLQPAPSTTLLKKLILVDYVPMSNESHHMTSKLHDQVYVHNAHQNIRKVSSPPPPACDISNIACIALKLTRSLVRHSRNGRNQPKSMTIPTLARANYSSSHCVSVRFFKRTYYLERSAR